MGGNVHSTSKGFGPLCRQKTLGLNMDGNNEKRASMEVLLVEDSQGDVRLTLEAFAKPTRTSKGYVSHDGAEALEFLRNEGAHANAPRPEFILLDLNMPKRDDRKVLAEIRRIRV
jgi:CheY-like chemotaxis protein